MNGYLPAYEMITPSSLVEAMSCLSESPGKWTPIAGGTDLMVLLESGRLQAGHFLNIVGIEDLKGISVTDSEVTFGALTTYSQIQDHDVISKEYPVLAQACREVAGIAIQNRGTIGGNIVNASPAADSTPALLVYDATLTLVSIKGERTVKLSEFYKGYKKMDIVEDELLKSISLPRRLKEEISYFRKVGTRKAQAISKVVVAAVAAKASNKIGEIRVSMGSVAPTTIRCLKAEAVVRGQIVTDELINKACSALDSEIAPIDDIRSSMEFRNQIAVNVFAEFLRELK